MKGKNRKFSISSLSSIYAQTRGMKQALNFKIESQMGKPAAMGLSSMKPRTLIA
jgi:hypothetical protein